MKIKEVFVILTKCTNTRTRDVEIKISGEAYDSLEKAQRFIENRVGWYKIDEFNYESDDPYHFGFVYQYTIAPVTVI